MVEIAWFLRWTALWQRLSGVQILVGWYEKDRQVVLLDYIVDLIWYLAINLCPGKRIAAQCSKIGKKVQFQKYKNTLFAISKMAKNQFLHQKKV